MSPTFFPLNSGKVDAEYRQGKAHVLLQPHLVAYTLGADVTPAGFAETEAEFTASVAKHPANDLCRIAVVTKLGAIPREGDTTVNSEDSPKRLP